MSSSYTYTQTETSAFTVTHARHMSAKVATDLKRMQRYYPATGPSDQRIADYEAELTAYLKGGYLKSVSYGFRRDGKWIEPSVTYTAKDLLAGFSANDDDPGRIAAAKDVSGATFYSFLVTNDAWAELTADQRASFKATLPLQRDAASAPGVSGYLVEDKTYSSGGRALIRTTVKSF